MINILLKKGLVCGILVLFLGMSIVPITGSTLVEKHSPVIGSVKEINNLLKTESRGINVTLHGTMGENGWYISPVDIVVTADNGTEIERVLYSIDHGGWVEYNEPFIVTAAGSHLLDVRVYDQYGNEWNFSFVIKIDMNLPTIVLQKEKMFLNKIKFIANVSDESSGIWQVEFYLDDEFQFTDYNSPFEWIWEGTGNHTVTAKVFDWAGHSASSAISTPCTQSQSNPCVQQNSQNLSITDLTRSYNPEIKTGQRGVNITLKGTMGNGGWYISPVEIIIIFENDTFYEYLYYRIDFGEWIKYTAPVDTFVSGDGHHTLSYYFVDYDGEPGPDTQPRDFSIDMTPPWIFLKTQITHNRIVFTAVPADNMSGIGYIEFYFNDVLQFTANAPGPYEWTLAPWPNINGTITVIVYDGAGNNASFSFWVWKSFATGIVTNLKVSGENITCFALILFSSDDGLHMRERVTFPNRYAGFVGKHLILAEFYHIIQIP